MPNERPNIVIWGGYQLDIRETSDMGPRVRSSVTNAAAFEHVFRRRADTSAAGLAELEDLSPVDTSALQAAR
jgi:hypothetical protein